MLYSRNILPSCSYCRYGSDIGGGEVACVKRGIMSAAGSCRQYVYDPLKRVPDRHAPLTKPILDDELPEELAGEPADATAVCPQAERDGRPDKIPTAAADGCSQD